MATFNTATFLGLAVALGIGLLIGVDRERRKGKGASRQPAGIRTFAITSLAGAVGYLTGGALVLATVVAGVVLLTALGYWLARRDDPGLTTEIALITAALLGGLSMERPELAAAIAVVVTALLASRTRLHRFVTSVLTEDEIRHGLVLAGATLVILPLVPDRPMGPFGALNPRAIWIVVILVMAISAAGYIAVRLIGARLGLPIAGLVSGFVSSTATIGAMGQRAARDTTTMTRAVAAAILSSVATVVQMAVVLGATSRATLIAMAIPLAAAMAMAFAYAAAFTIHMLRQPGRDDGQAGRPFSLKMALIFALTLSCVLLVSAALKEWFGVAGVLAAVSVAGFVDTHAAAISVATLVATGKIDAVDAVLPILAAFSTNTISKMVIAQVSGGTAFGFRVIPGLLLVAAAAWCGALATWP